jgi:hypothetical protein
MTFLHPLGDHTMIHFQCWSCDQAHEMPEGCIGEYVECGCGNRLRVPAHDGSDRRVWTLVDRVRERLAYGGWGAVAGLVLGLAVVGLGGMHTLTSLVVIPLVATLTGLLIGLLGGERAFLWFGSKVISFVEGAQRR